MDQEPLKIGDKVKVVKSSPKFYLCGNKIWTVVVEPPPNIIAQCNSKYRTFLPTDLKHAYQNSEQLLFSFMYD